LPARLGVKETKYLSELANLLYSWLPGSAPPFGRTYTLADAAQENDLAPYWTGGSKLPALQALLQAALMKVKLRGLVSTIVREGIKYRDKRGPPITREEVETLNEIMFQLGYKISDISDPLFLAMFPFQNATTGATISTFKLGALLQRYKMIGTNPDPQSRGYELQDLLIDLFAVSSLLPKSAFRVTGEEIDGSFVLDSEIYLLEARWRKKITNKSELLTFHGKITGKSEWTRGLFLSVKGFTSESLDSMRIGNRPNFVVMNGIELENALKGKVALNDLIRKKVRILAETSDLYVEPS
jgi:hypothetical protein